ncbi:M20 family metallopeptidase [Dictyobacter arantiisoli]|uniref:Acetylornithine deacetylase n=1 Tax=Dictyobacter arantiisoli TaxID=2014874 RepID=A0A5A5T7L3_9CHLR|nr:M20 family metallopeptidase [Dictyobacter arantiisoli]GCF06939.1 acetylornithine deacetylase [Dictyobacter arantiisoli]
MSTSDDMQKSELWEVSRRLIGMDTVSAHSNLEAAEYLAHYLQESGFESRILTDEVEGVKKASVLAWFGPQEPGGLMISGHIDTVPFDGQPDWKTNPLELQTDGKRIYGRGTADMKIFLAQAVVAARQVHQQHSTFKHPLLFVFTYDEEIAGQGSGHLVHNILPTFFKETLPMPEYALIGEPTDFNIFPAHKGFATFDVVVRGKGGHSSVPKQGLNAIKKMSDVIQIIDEIDQELQQRITPENLQLFPECPTSAFNYGVIKGGLATNMIADTCRLNVSLRVSPGDNEEEILNTMRARIEQEIAREMRAFSPECGVFIEHLHATPPMKSPLESPISHLLSRIIEKPVEHGAPYGTDAGQFQLLNINSYVCGPGTLEQAHQPNESIPIEHFLTGQKHVERIIYEWCVKGV